MGVDDGEGEHVAGDCHRRTHNRILDMVEVGRPFDEVSLVASAGKVRETVSSSSQG